MKYTSRRDLVGRSKLTIAIPDDLRRRAKSIAALRDESLSDVIVKALEEYVSEAIEEAGDIRLVHEVETRIAHGESAWHDWAEVEKELSALSD
jgi:predicted transcriptional regulator